MQERNRILETERLYLRELAQDDYSALSAILQDGETMYAYEGAFSDAEVQEWLDRQRERYRNDGFGLWAVVLKATGAVIGQCGLTRQPWKDGEVLEVGYLLNRRYWHNGYATEAACTCTQYAFETLGAAEVCSIIRDTNIASQQVALQNGMTEADRWTKQYRGVAMPHIRFVAKNTQVHTQLRRGGGAGARLRSRGKQKQNPLHRGENQHDIRRANRKYGEQG